MLAMFTHAYYKDLFMQLLNCEEVGYEAGERGISITLHSKYLDEVQTLVFLRGKLLTFCCENIAQVDGPQLSAIYKMLNDLNSEHDDIKFLLDDKQICVTLQSFILQDKMVSQCLVAMQRLTDVLDNVYPKIKYVLK